MPLRAAAVAVWCRPWCDKRSVRGMDISSACLYVHVYSAPNACRRNVVRRDSRSTAIRLLCISVLSDSTAIIVPDVTDSRRTSAHASRNAASWLSAGTAMWRHLLLVACFVIVLYSMRRYSLLNEVYCLRCGTMRDVCIGRAVMFMFMSAIWRDVIVCYTLGLYHRKIMKASWEIYKIITSLLY